MHTGSPSAFSSLRAVDMGSRASTFSSSRCWTRTSVFEFARLAMHSVTALGPAHFDTFARQGARDSVLSAFSFELRVDATDRLKQRRSSIQDPTKNDFAKVGSG